MAGGRTDTFAFRAITGISTPAPDNAFLGSLTGSAALKVRATHWLALVLPHMLTKVGAAVHVPIRLICFIFVPSMLLNEAVDSGDAAFFPLPVPLGLFLRNLLAKGMPATPLTTPSAAQALVQQYAAQLDDADRLFEEDNVQVTPCAGTPLQGVTPFLLRGSDRTNLMLAWLHTLLPGYYVNLTSGAMPSALALLKPTTVEVR